MDDVFTSADTKAQEVYLRTFNECFPVCGVVAEENNLTIAGDPTYDAYFTVDPLDGTKAFVRRQSHGIATMVALVRCDKIISAYVGDINTEEVYGYRPDSDHVHRITQLDTFETMRREGPVRFDEHYVLLRDPPEAYSAASRELVREKFKNYEVMGSSIGTWAARLWKNEVAALLIPPGWETPWDSTPVIGISRKLGYRYFRPLDSDVRSSGRWQRYIPSISREKFFRPHDTLIVHAHDVALVPQ
jgi:fructose-1,6-bisphosphatase/inositol monophosphatase family enzyme